MASRAKRFKKQPPEGWDLIEPTIEELDKKMKEGKLTFCHSSLRLLRNFFASILAQTDPHEGKRKVEALWPIFRIHHQRSRYVFDLYYTRKAISKGKCESNLLSWHQIASRLLTGVERLTVVILCGFQNCSTSAVIKVWQTERWLRNGVSRATNSCAVCAAYRLATRILEQIVSAAYRRRSWSEARWLNAYIVAVVVALASQLVTVFRLMADRLAASDLNLCSWI